MDFPLVEGWSFVCANQKECADVRVTLDSAVAVLTHFTSHVIIYSVVVLTVEIRLNKLI